MEIASLYHIFQQHPLVTTDSRNCPSGSIFFALKGASFDGNAFALQALEQGCAYAVVDDPRYASSQDKRLIVVDDCLAALQQLAHYHRRQLGTRVIGVTGTNGKTTTKELIATVLAKKYRVLYTQGNLNNHIGVPLTLLRLTAEHEMAVVEMGANHPGEIDQLVHIVEPDYGIITNVGKAHLEGFGTFEEVIHTKTALYRYLRTKPESVAFIHNDNPYLMAEADGLNLVRYGKSDDKEMLHVNGEVVECAPTLTFRWRVTNTGWHRIATHLIGAYNIDNMLAAAAIGIYFGVTPQQVDEALAGYTPQNNRSQLKVTADNSLIVDAYNANPTSMMAALANFTAMKVSPKMAILGDMKELGASTAEEHQRIVDYLAKAAFDVVWLVGDNFRATHSPFRCFADADEVRQSIEAGKPHGYYILIKGSNSMRLAPLADLL